MFFEAAAGTYIKYPNDPMQSYSRERSANVPIMTLPSQIFGAQWS